MAGLGRTVEVSALAKEWGTEESATLRDLVAQAPAGPWGEIFEGHLKAMTELTARVRELRDANDQFLRAAARFHPGEAIAEWDPSQHLRFRAAGPARTPAPDFSTRICENPMSTFGALNTAFSGLTAASQGLSVVGQNIANANTVVHPPARQHLRH